MSMAVRVGVAALAGLLLPAVARAAPATSHDATTRALPRRTASPTDRVAAPVVVRDVTIPVPGQDAVRAYLVRPAHPVPARSLAGVLYLHWLEPPAANQNRTEFLAEAVATAGRGAVALLPDLTFPWNGEVNGDARDAAAVRAQRDAVAAAYRTLLAEHGVDHARTAVVGHDYGAMYAALLARDEPGVRAAVLAAPDATWSNWFATYFVDVPDRATHDALFAGLDPVDAVTALGSRLYLQWAGRDVFVPAQVREAFAAADPAAAVTLYPRDDHALSDVAVVTDRAGFLAARLGLG